MSSDRNESRRALILKRTEETREIKQVLKTLSSRLESPSFQKTLSSPEFKSSDYESERKILRTLNNIGLLEGVTAGIVTFVAFRRGPQWIQRLVKQRQFRNRNNGGNGYQLDRPLFQNSSEQQQQQRNQNPRAFTYILSTMKLGLDVFVSMLVAASTSMYFLDDAKLADKVASIPLVEGRSIVSDEFCSTLQSELSKSSSRSKHVSSLWKNTDNTYMKNMIRFAKNCQKRQAYEKALREEQGLGSDAPIPIPHGGVPPDFDIGDENDIFQQQQQQNDDNNNGSSFGTAESGDAFFGNDDYTEQDKPVDELWGDSMVTDRENDKTRKWK